MTFRRVETLVFFSYLLVSLSLSLWLLDDKIYIRHIVRASYTNKCVTDKAPRSLRNSKPIYIYNDL